ncbi:MAG: DUF4854 domain-containing protein [Oscillospiraceae bacterium]|nr:DUF4854 domain-containing protein [Oscillospiraceae bacterium]
MKKVVALVLALVMVITLTACDNTKTASDYLEAMPADMRESLSTPGMDIKISSEGDTIIFTYTYDLQIDSDSLAGMKDTFDSMEGSLNSIANPVVKEMETFGVKNPQVRFVYCNKDGGVIWQKTF